MPPLQLEMHELRGFLLSSGDWPSIGARTFGADVDHVGAVGDEFPRFLHGGGDIAERHRRN